MSQLSAGLTFWGGRPGQKLHLYFVITDPDANGNVWFVNMTSDDADETCVLVHGDHPSVKHPSVIKYNKISNALTQKGFEDAVKRGLFIPEVNANITLIERIRDGILKSKYTPKDMKTAWREYEAAYLRD